MTRPKGTREQIHDLVDNLDELILDIAVNSMLKAKKMSFEMKASRERYRLAEVERRSEEATTTI